MKLNSEAARLLLQLLPRQGAVDDDALQKSNSRTYGLINCLFSWAEQSHEPLQSHATGLLATTMQLLDVAENFHGQNLKLSPLMLKRLCEIQKNGIDEDRTMEINSGIFLFYFKFWS